MSQLSFHQKKQRCLLQRLDALLMWQLALLILFAELALHPVAVDSSGESKPLPFCTANDHVKGSWKRIENATRSFQCTFATKNDFYKHGKLNESTTVKEGCECDQYMSPFDADERLKYEWVPDNCKMREWNSFRFCNLLGNRTILFIGDSTMEQTAATVMSMISNAGASCAPQLLYGRSNYFVYDVKEVDRQWWHYYEENPSDIVVLTAGAWFADFGDLNWALGYVNKTIERWRSTETSKKSDVKVPTIFWKTQNPGHVFCDDFHFPISAMQEKMMNLTEDAHGWKFHWELFPQFDAIARQYFPSIGVGIIDMSPLYLRPDAHVGKLGTYHRFEMKNDFKTDCLHYCVPGPLDIFATLLYQTLHDMKK